VCKGKKPHAVTSVGRKREGRGNRIFPNERVATKKHALRRNPSHCKKNEVPRTKREGTQKSSKKKPDGKKWTHGEKKAARRRGEKGGSCGRRRRFQGCCDKKALEISKKEKTGNSWTVRTRTQREEGRVVSDGEKKVCKITKNGVGQKNLRWIERMSSVQRWGFTAGGSAKGQGKRLRKNRSKCADVGNTT